jgi:hypothetical protein
MLPRTMVFSLLSGSTGDRRQYQNEKKQSANA